MRLRLPVLILAGTLGLVVLFALSGSGRIGEIILRSPIVLLREAVARALAILNPSEPAIAVVPASTESTAASPAAQPTTGLLKNPDASAASPAQKTAPRQTPERVFQGAPVRSDSISDRLRGENRSASAGTTQIGVTAQPGLRFELAGTEVANNPVVTTTIDAPVAVQPPTDLQPPVGIIAPGNIVGLLDGVVPPGGVLVALNPVTALLSGILPAGSVISPSGVVQLPAGIQVPAGIQLPSGGQPGQVQLSPIQLGPIQTGPIQVGPGQSGSGPSGGGPSGPAQGGPVQIGPVQIGPIQVGPPR